METPTSNWQMIMLLHRQQPPLIALLTIKSRKPLSIRRPLAHQLHSAPS
jgi:hypothetical protein